MKHWKFAAAFAAEFALGCSLIAWAGQVPYPINADNAINAGDFLLGNGPQRAIDSGWAVVPLANGGCNTALAASNGGILYSTASACAILAGTSTADRLLLSGAGVSPSWSTATWPVTTTANDLLYSTASNTVGQLATAGNSILATNASGVPGWATAIPSGVSLPLPTATTLGGVESQSCPSHQWIDVIPTTQIQPTCAQPAIADISGISATAPLAYSGGTWSLNIGTGLTTSGGNLALATPGATTLGGVESYAAVSHQWINAVSTGGVHSSTQPAFSDISGTVAASQLPTPTASTLGGIESLACPSHQWHNNLDTSGVLHCAQPDVADLVHNPVLAATGYASGPYYTQFNATLSTASVAANTLYAMPFFAGVSKTFTKVSFDQTTSGTATECELGQYADNGSGAPGNLIADFGQIAPSGQSEITSISAAVTPGINWFAVACNGTSTFEASSSTVNGQFLGFSTGATPYGRWQMSWTFSTGNLPSAFGGAANTGSPFLIYLRY